MFFSSTQKTPTRVIRGVCLALLLMGLALAATTLDHSGPVSGIPGVAGDANTTTFVETMLGRAATTWWATVRGVTMMVALLRGDWWPVESVLDWMQSLGGVHREPPAVHRLPGTNQPPS